MTGSIRDLSDRVQIQDLVTRYGRSLDDRDWESLAGCFAAGVEADLGFGAGALQGTEALVEACRSALGMYDTTQHLLSPAEIELDGDSALVRCNVQATHIRQGSVFVVGGSYTDHVERTEEGWRIRRHQLSVSWMQGSP